MAASRRPRISSRTPKHVRIGDKPTTRPAPAAALEPTTENAPVPGSQSPEARAIKKSIVPKSSKMPGQEVIAAIQTLLQLEKQAQLLDGGVETISQHVLKQIEDRSHANLLERIQATREQIRDSIKSGTLLPQSKDLLTDRIDRCFETLEGQLIQKEEIPLALGLRKLSRSLPADIRQILSQCLNKLDSQNIPLLSICIHMDLPKAARNNLKQAGVDAVFQKHLLQFFEENLSKADLEALLERMIHLHPQLFDDMKQITITDEIFRLLATATWDSIKESLGTNN